jgi:hypothetical protein
VEQVVLCNCSQAVCTLGCKEMRAATFLSSSVGGKVKTIKGLLWQTAPRTNKPSSRTASQPSPRRLPPSAGHFFAPYRLAGVIVAHRPDRSLHDLVSCAVPVAALWPRSRPW